MGTGLKNIFYRINNNQLDKIYSREVTKRFLEASEVIITENKLTKGGFAESVHVLSSNLIRMKNNPDQHNVPLEALCEMVYQYKISPVWLITGHGDKQADPQKQAAREILKSRVVGMELAVDEIRANLKILKKAAR